MRTTYDPKADVFYARFAPGGIEIADLSEAAHGVTIDLDAPGQLVGVGLSSVIARATGAYGASAVRGAAE